MSVADLIDARRGAFLQGASPAQSAIRGAWRDALDDNIGQILSPEDQSLFASGRQQAARYLADPSMADPVGGQGYAVGAVDKAISSGNPDGYLRARMGGGANATTALAQSNGILDPTAQRGMASYYANALGQRAGDFNSNTFLSKMGGASTPYQDAIGGALDGGSGAFGTALSSAPQVAGAVQDFARLGNPSGTAAAMDGNGMLSSAMNLARAVPHAFGHGVLHGLGATAMLPLALGYEAGKHLTATALNAPSLARRAVMGGTSPAMDALTDAGRSAMGGVPQALGAFGNYYAPTARGAFGSVANQSLANRYSEE